MTLDLEGDGAVGTGCRRPRPRHHIATKKEGEVREQAERGSGEVDGAQDGQQAEPRRLPDEENVTAAHNLPLVVLGASRFHGQRRLPHPRSKSWIFRPGGCGGYPKLGHGCENVGIQRII